MALTDNGGTTMLVQPSGFGGGFGSGFGGDGWWILLLLLAFGGGWGGMGGFGGDGIYPWLNNSQNLNDGFRDQMLQTSVSSIGDKITSGFGDVATALIADNTEQTKYIVNRVAPYPIPSYTVPNPFGTATTAVR